MSVNIRFEGKRILVTGVGKGIGRVIAKTLVDSGAEVFGISRTQDDLDSLKKEVPAINTINVDLGDWAATRKAVESIAPIHFLVNNAAIAVIKPFLEITEEELNKNHSININGIINVSQVVARGMVERGEGGAIVNISSIASSFALNHHIAYCLSKGALTSMTQCMALELGPHKVRVNNVEPTVTMTPMGRRYWDNNPRTPGMLSRHPMGSFIEEKDVADATMFLLSDAASMITGTTLRVDAGMMCN